MNINAPEFMVKVDYNSEFDYSLSYEEREFAISSKEEIINFPLLFLIIFFSF